MGRNFRMSMRGYSRRQVDELFIRIDRGQVAVADLRQARFDKQVRAYAMWTPPSTRNSAVSAKSPDGLP